MSLLPINAKNKPTQIIDTGSSKSSASNSDNIMNSINIGINKTTDAITTGIDNTSQVITKITSPLNKIIDKTVDSIEGAIDTTADTIADFFNKNDNKVVVTDIPPASPNTLNGVIDSTSLYNAYKPNPQIDIQTLSSNIDNSNIVNYLNNIEYKDNVLNGLANCTYSFSLFSIPLYDLIHNYENNYYKMNNSSNDFIKSFNNKAIIVQQGVTAGFSIHDVVINTVAGFNPNTKNVTTTTINFKITEVYGCSLLDKIINLCKIYGYPQFQDMPLFLTLNFKGYDENGNIKTLPEYTYIYPIIITSIKPNLMTGNNGTEYEIQSICKNDLNLLINNHTLEDNISFKASTFKEAIDNLQKQLNDKMKRRYPEFIQVTDQFYIIEIPDDMSNLEFISKQGKENIKESKSKAIEFTFDASDTIQRCINSIYNQLELPNSDSITYNTNINTEKQIREYINISCFNQYLGYSSHYNTYIRKYTYSINKKQIISGITNINATPEEKINNLITNDLLSKQYQHNYTGKNIDIIDVDINIDNMFSIVISKNLVGTNTLLRHSTSAIQEPITIQSEGNKWTPINLNNESTDSSLTTTNNILSSINNNTPIENALTPQNMSIVNNQNDIVLFDKVESVGKSGIIYLEDVPFRLDSSDINKVLTPTKIVSNMNTQLLYNKSSDNSYEKPEILDKLSLLEQVFGKLNMIMMDITIKGDPFWLGNIGVFINNNNYADYTKGEQSFYFVTKITEGVDENSGLYKIKSGVSFRGIYSVLTIEHTFTNGLFKQKLTAKKTDINI